MISRRIMREEQTNRINIAMGSGKKERRRSVTIDQWVHLGSMLQEKSHTGKTMLSSIV
jgi:hypothetical protein